MAEAFIQPACDFAMCLWAPIGRRIFYARNLPKNFKVLCEEASELFSRRNDINVEIDRRKLEKTPTQICEDWLTKVGEVENKIRSINQDFHVEHKCLRGLCPNIFALIKLGEQVVEMIDGIKVLLEKSKFLDGFLTDSPPPKVEKQPVPASNLTASSKRMLEEVLDKIRDKSTPKIGIWGMGGVGKTTVMQLLNNTSEIAAMFDFVIWLTVSKSWSIRNLQHRLGQRLSIKITNDDSDDRVVSKLLKMLEGKKYLLLLDDVWEMVDLSAVGLPNANQGNGCKVVLTTREFTVCRMMETDSDINVKVFSELEAEEMFYSNVGDILMSPTIRCHAKEIVRECAGLPLVLKIVSSILRKVENGNVWMNVLKDLQSPSTSLIENMDEKVFKRLKVSYENLKDTEKKNCFLYCGLYPEDRKIKKSRLIGYWRAEGLLSTGKLTLADACVKGDAILEALIDSSLLERCEGDDEHVKMHDVVRDLVLRMTSPKGEECTHLVRAGISTEEEMPEDEEWKKATRISFMDHDLQILPELPDCPKLLTLLLRENGELEVIPESFFNNMPGLRVLDLSYTGIKMLPTSISNLTSLRSLLLDRCDELNVLPEEISTLKGLEVLQVTGTKMAHLPLRISELTALKCLKFWSGSRDKWLGAVRELQIGGSVVVVVDIVAEELSRLTALSSLEFDFGRVSNLQHFLQNSSPWRNGRLTTFRFIVGEYSSRYGQFRGDFRKYKRCLHFIGGEGSSILSSAVGDVLGRSDCFVLEGHGELNTLSEVNTCGLRHCHLVGCGALENVIDRNGLEMDDAFRNLESLSLSQLSNFRHILCLELEGPSTFSPPPPPSPSPLPSSINSFTNLRKLELTDCPRIKQLLSGFMIRQLYNLEELYVRRCEGLEGMISEDEKVEYEGALPKLKEVSLTALPEFVSFFKGVPMCWPSLEKVWINECPKLRKLPFDVHNAAGLKEIKGSREWWDALEWDDNAIQLQLQPLFSLFLSYSEYHPYYYPHAYHQYAYHAENACTIS